MLSLPLEVVIERDPDSLGKEWSLWLGMVILMDTRLPSRQREGAVFGEEGAQAVREVMRTIHPLSDVSDTREVKKKKKGSEILEAFPEVSQPF